MNTFRTFATLLISLALLTACAKPPTDEVQGYVEGEFVYVASPLAGQLNTLSVDRGAQIHEGEPLFTLDSTSEAAARDEATRRLAQAQATLEDAKKGRRPTEIDSLRAQLEQAKAALDLAEKQYARTADIAKNGAVSQQEVDQDRSARDQALQHVAQLQADLKTADLPQRSDLITAAEEEVKARQATLAQAQWSLSQKHQDSPRAGLVFDTLYRPGEWVAAGHPVVAILPPENIKVRAFVNETRIASLHPGDSLTVSVDGAAPLTGKISFISPKAEYTPPVIYSQENRSKLVFMIEIVFDPQSAATLHPGQPVDVHLQTAKRATP